MRNADRAALVRTVATLEQLAARADALDRRLKSGATAMADQATDFAHGHRRRVTAGNPTAAAEMRRALVGRTRARRLTEEA